MPNHLVQYMDKELQPQANKLYSYYAPAERHLEHVAPEPMPLKAKLRLNKLNMNHLTVPKPVPCDLTATKCHNLLFDRNSSAHAAYVENMLPLAGVGCKGILRLQYRENKVLKFYMEASSDGAAKAEMTVPEEYINADQFFSLGSVRNSWLHTSGCLLLSLGKSGNVWQHSLDLQCEQIEPLVARMAREGSRCNTWIYAHRMAELVSALFVKENVYYLSLSLSTVFVDEHDEVYLLGGEYCTAAEAIHDSFQLDMEDNPYAPFSYIM